MSVLRNGKWFFFWNNQHHHFLQNKCKMNSFSSGLFIAENWRKRFLLRKRRVDRNRLCWSDKGEKVGNTASQFTPKKMLNLVVYNSPQKHATVIVLLHTLQGAESRQVMRELDGRREAPTRWEGRGEGVCVTISGTSSIVTSTRRHHKTDGGERT